MLSAPYGFAKYTWYNADMSQKVSDGRNFTISPAPPDKTRYSVVVTPYDGLGCIDTLYTLVNRIDGGFKLDVLNYVLGCTDVGIDLTDPKITAGSSAGMTYSYYMDSLSVSYLPNPDKVLTSGVYYIRGINADGCTNILPITVDLTPPVISATDPPPVNFPTRIDLSKTYTAYPGLTYSYFKDAATTITVPNFATVAKSGTYFIKATNAAGCITIVPVNVVVNPPLYTVTAPNVFTPNNDGINDNFTVSVIGYITFNYVKIFNRYGQLVFSTTTKAGYWDGNLNGKRLPVDTYYWIFYGTDEYYPSNITYSGSITLVR
jgi:gliding motility-associated-like protein